MNIDTAQFGALFSVEIGLGALAVLLIVVDLLLGRGRLTGPADAVRLLASLGLIALLVHACRLEPLAESGTGAVAYGTLDAFALYWKRFFLATALLTLVVSAAYEARLPAGRAEFPTLIVFTTLGLCLLASVNDFVTLFVALELVTITLFLLTAWRAGLPRSIEAGIKFVVIGALAAAFLVYGIAWVYGGTGRFDFESVRAVVEAGPASGARKFGLRLVLVGLGFKLGAVPFHVWIPDVYQGAPTPVTAFLSVGSKAAGVVLLMRFVHEVLGAGAHDWLLLLAGLSAATLLMGNLAAIPQTNLKRFLGYSGIAHAGYLLLALATHSLDSAGAMLFYMATYLFANVAAFLVLVVVSRTEDNSHMDRLDGLANRSPFLAFALTVALLSLAGVPPLAGFSAKWMILRAAVAEPQLLWLVILAGVMIVVSLYYYLCIIKRMYMREAKDTGVLELTGGTRWVLLGCVLATLIFGMWQAPLYELARSGAASLFG
ncbi:MAG: NADH-quinone oxidoreductase subunit N [Planctomycetota bacterium]